MKLMGKAFIFMALLAGVALQGSYWDPQAAKHEQLCEATATGSLEEVQTMLSQKADPNWVWYHGASRHWQWPYNKPLEIAVCRGRGQVVELLLSAGADPNRPAWTSSHFSLHVAFRAIDKGIKGTRDYNPDPAAYTSIVKLLLEHKANPNQKFGQLDESAMDLCLMLIMKYKLSDSAHPILQAMKLLLDHGADTTQHFRDYFTIYTCAEENPALKEILKPYFEARVADAVPKFSRDLTKLIALYVI